MAFVQTQQLRQLHPSPGYGQPLQHSATSPSQKPRSFSPPALSDKHKKMLKKNKANIGLYCAAGLTFLFFFFFLSDGDFSFFLTLGGLVRLLSFSLLLFKCFTTRNSSGVSPKTLQLYALVFFSRLCSILIHEGYLPFDSSGDWLYPSVEALSLTAVLATAYVVCVKYGSPEQARADSFGAGHKFGAAFIAVPCLVLAVAVHPSLNEHWFTDITWTFALYLETLAVLPQLFMFQRQSKGKPVEEWTAHFVACLGAARMLSLVFWAFSYHELSHDEGGWVGCFVLCAQLVHLLVMGDFVYYYLKALKNGLPLVLGDMAGNMV